MKKSKGQFIFPGTLLLTFGLFFFIRNSLNVDLNSWAVALFLVGLAFLFHAYFGKQYESLLPAVLFVGIGIHLHLANMYHFPNDSFGIIFLFLACGFFLRYFKTKTGLFYGWIFLIFAVFQLFPDPIFATLQKIVPGTIDLTALWPLILILTSVYIFFFKRRS